MNESTGTPGRNQIDSESTNRTFSPITVDGTTYRHLSSALLMFHRVSFTKTSIIEDNVIRLLTLVKEHPKVEGGVELKRTLKYGSRKDT